MVNKSQANWIHDSTVDHSGTLIPLNANDKNNLNDLCVSLSKLKIVCFC